jgi:hypothetical protein
MPRRIELTDELTQKICEKILIGLPHESAAKRVGVPYKLFKEWMASGEAGDSPKYVEFYKRVKMTDEEYEKNQFEAIKQAAKEGDKGASRWLKEKNIEY